MGALMSPSLSFFSVLLHDPPEEEEDDETPLDLGWNTLMGS